ncbi:MAG: hemolysin family protein [Pseudomonadota bacterium]
MGDTTDGSSSAAHGAQTEIEDQTHRPTRLWDRLFRRKTDTGEPPQDNLELTEAQAADARAMLSNVHNLRGIRVQDVAVPRADIVAVTDAATLEDIVEVFRTSTLTRLPVYGETLDSPSGFIHLKDIALRYGFDCQDTRLDLRKLLRPLLYVPPSMPITVLLQKMQTERVHMALVIDEYGGVDGLVTIEDLVEQIVGEIADEHDADEAVGWSEEAPGVYLCSARAELEAFEAAAGVDLLPDASDEDVDTLGGLVFMLAGRVPLRGEVIPHPDGHELEVVDADPRLVKRLRVRLRHHAALDQAAE